jgi:hypothetical protein
MRHPRVDGILHAREKVDQQTEELLSSNWMNMFALLFKVEMRNRDSVIHSDDEKIPQIACA